MSMQLAREPWQRNPGYVGKGTEHRDLHPLSRQRFGDGSKLFPARGGLTTYAFAASTYTVLMFTNSRMPCSASSRP
jgi:hypothetical protein